MRKSLGDIIHLWEAFRGKKILKPQIKEVLSGGYSFKPASKLYELWTLRAILDTTEEHYSRKWTPKHKKEKAIFSLKVGEKKLILTYNFAKKSYHKFSPQIRQFRPDFVLALKNNENEGDQILFISDAKYKPKVDTQDLERMLAYMVSYGWGKPLEVANAIFLYIGNNNVPNGKFETFERKNPAARVYSICLRPNPQTYDSAKNNLKLILEDCNI